jgi:amino acid adenylation domain-containing protein
VTAGGGGGVGCRLETFVARQAAAAGRPEATALVEGDGARVGYAELDARANRLARVLREAGCRPGDRVGLLLPKSADAVAAMLAALKADALYVPIDPEGPPARAALILADAGCRVLLAGDRTAAVAGGLAAAGDRTPVGWLSTSPPPPAVPEVLFTARDVAAASARPVEAAGGPEAPAHILFTSGSTGAPKGVVVGHANVAAFVAWANRHFGLRADDRVSCHSPLHFDLSTWDLFGAFAAGAEVHLVPPELNLAPRRLVAFIRDRRLTQWFSVPSLLAYLARLDAVPREGLPDLRRVIWCGEPFPPAALAAWMERLPGAAFTNLYGPTETTIASAWHDVAAPPPAGEDVPIGRACGGEELLVLGDDLRPVPAGAVGEIVIGGAGVTRGYWRDEERTRRTFVPDPRAPAGGGGGARLYRTGDLGRVGEDGLLRFLGRRDGQVKVRGHRVELGEVEAALDRVDGVGQAVALAVRREAGAWGGAEIGCAYALRPGADLPPARLRERLGVLLPRHMLPTRWLRLDRLPSNGNGKIDRASLRAMLEGAAPAAAPEGAARG